MLCGQVQKLFSRTGTIQTLSFEDIFAGKLCAALDRQHPRDLYDVKLLLENEGIPSNLRKAFIIYLISNDRPIHELLNPNRLDISAEYENEFKTMTFEEIPLRMLLEIREELIAKINTDLTTTEREFLLSVKKGTPRWELINLPGVEQLPSIKWKIINIGKMEPKKHRDQLEKLRTVLEI